MHEFAVCRTCDQPAATCGCAHRRDPTHFRKERFFRVSRVRVPMCIVIGRYEHLTERELRDHYFDIVAECGRRGLSFNVD